jgi:hypothetical protein
MFSWLKKHFIPHDGNDNRPHILRARSVRAILIVVLFLEVFTYLLPTIAHINRTGGMAAVLPAVLADLTNDERQAEHLSTLTVNPILNEAAQMKATDMATKGYFAHTSPEGKTPWYWLGQVGYDYQYAGENLAINFNDSKDVTAAWMNSPTHKANIVKGNYTQIGTGVATGLYEGRETIFVAQVYANPVETTSLQREDQTKPKTTLPVAAKEEVKTKTTAVQVREVPESVVAKQPTSVLGAEVDSPSKTVVEPEHATEVQKLVASPRNTTNMILDIIYAIIIIALTLYIIIKARNHHRGLITNGLVMLAVIGAIFVANYYISHKNMVVMQSLDYGRQGE